MLEQAQLQLMRHLLPTLLDKAKKSYEFHHNPLGLTDTFTARIRKFVPKDFKALCQLGKGSFGEVYLVEKIDTGIQYALKVLRKEKLIGNNLIKYAFDDDILHL